MDGILYLRQDLRAPRKSWLSRQFLNSLRSNRRNCDPPSSVFRPADRLAPIKVSNTSIADVILIRTLLVLAATLVQSPYPKHEVANRKKYANSAAAERMPVRLQAAEGGGASLAAADV